MLPQFVWLKKGSDDARFTFGGSIELIVAEDNQKTLLKAWPMQCFGYPKRALML